MSETLGIGLLQACVLFFNLSHDVASESDIRPSNKIDKPQVVYRFTGNVMTSIIRLRKIRELLNVFTPKIQFFRTFNGM